MFLFSVVTGWCEFEFTTLGVVCGGCFEGSSPIVVDKPRSSFSSYKQTPSSETATPWFRLLTQYPQVSPLVIESFSFLLL